MLIFVAIVATVALGRWAWDYRSRYIKRMEMQEFSQWLEGRRRS